MDGLVQKVNGTSVVEAQPSLYSISVAEFQRPGPTNPQDYNLSDRVTRETFASFLIESFRTSRGSSDTQYYFLEWLMENKGFDYKTTFRNFIECRTWEWDSFSIEEKDKFCSEYHGMKSHERNKRTGEITKHGDVYISSSMHSYMYKLSLREGYIPQFKLNLEEPVEPLKGMSIERLRELINRHMKNVKEIMDI